MNIIDNYYWTIHFQNLSTGKIIIGDLPHNYEKEKYKEKELKLINTYSKENKIFWGIQFSAIKFDEITMTDIMIGKIDLKNLEIFGSYEYILKIEEIFFDKYKENYICSRTFDEVDGEDVFRFICDKNLFNKNDINLFPNLTLINVELNFSFIFTGNDLFIEKNDKIYFMIVSKVGRTQGEWNLGRIFLYKYQFIMDYDNKLIGIYKESERKIEEKIKEKNKNKYKFAILIIIIVLLVIFIVVLIIFAFIKKGFWKNRKKRISELDDGFLYITKELNCTYYTRIPEELVIPMYNLKKRLSMGQLIKSKKVWIEMITTSDFVRAQYNGWYRVNETGTCLVNNLGLTLTFDGLNISYNAYFIVERGGLFGPAPFANSSTNIQIQQ